MGEHTLIIVLAGVAAGFALLWRRIETLSLEVRILRAALDQARAEGLHGAEAQRALTQPVRVETETEIALSEAPLLAAMETAPKTFDDLFDAPWAKQKPAQFEPSAFQALQFEDWIASTPQAPALKETPRPLVRPKLFEQSPIPLPAVPDWHRAIWAMFAAGILAPFVALSANGHGISLVLAIAAYGFALATAHREQTPALAWLSTGAASLWALSALSQGTQDDLAIATPVALVLIGAMGLAHAALDRDWRPGAVLCAAMLAGLMTLTLRFGIVSSAGGAAAMLAALAATTGAAHPRLDALHLLGFAGAGLLLFCLSSEDQAGVWFTPAMGWAGAIFLGLAAARAPVLGPQGGLIAATGSIAPLFAIFGLFVAGHGLAEPWMASIALAGIAVLLATILAVSARAAGSLHALSMPGWILGAGAFIAASASLLLTWPLAQDGAAFGALAFGLVLSHRRATDNLLLCGAALWALAALASSIAALIAFNTTIDLWPLAMRIFCMAAPTLLLATAALRLRRDTPATRIVLEIAAGACGLLALSALVRAVFTGGAPAAYPIGLSELGGHVLLWAALSLALLRYFRGGAREARTTAAGALACGAGAATFIALALWFFGAWTPTATSATGLAAFGQHAPAGFALMACAAWLHWDHWRRRDNPLRALSAFAFACILTAAWISLEYTWFRPPLEDGADLTIIGMTLLLFAVALGLVGFYAVQQTRRSARSHFHKNLKRNRRSHQRG